jgi:hypothetical protein
LLCNKTLKSIHKLLFKKILFGYENMVATILECCFEFLETLQSSFESIWIQNAKIIKEIRKQKNIRRKEKKKKEKAPGEPLGPVRGISPQPRKETRTGTLCFPFLSLTRGPHSSGRVIIFFLPPLITPETESFPVDSPS